MNSTTDPQIDFAARFQARRTIIDRVQSQQAREALVAKQVRDDLLSYLRLALEAFADWIAPASDNAARAEEIRELCPNSSNEWFEQIGFVNKLATELRNFQDHVEAETKAFRSFAPLGILSPWWDEPRKATFRSLQATLQESERIRNVASRNYAYAITKAKDATQTLLEEALTNIERLPAESPMSQELNREALLRL